MKSTYFLKPKFPNPKIPKDQFARVAEVFHMEWLGTHRIVVISFEIFISFSCYDFINIDVCNWRSRDFVSNQCCSGIFRWPEERWSKRAQTGERINIMCNISLYPNLNWYLFIRQLLKNINVERDVKRKRDVIKKVIAYMTLGIDVSRLFTDMIMVRVRYVRHMCSLMLTLINVVV